MSLAQPGAAGARLAARIGDAWTCMAERYDELLPIFLDALAAAGRRRDEVAVIVGVGSGAGPGEGDDALLDDLPAATASWRHRGADELVLRWVRPAGLDKVLAAAERAGGPPADPSAPPAR